MKSKQDLTVGNINKKLWVFAIPLMLGNVMQQFYNLVDTWVVGKYIGDNALAAVGSTSSPARSRCRWRHSPQPSAPPA